MHVVVGRAVDEEELTAEFVGTPDGRDSVVVLVLLGSAHEALGVHGVVIAPVAGGCHCHATTEDGTAFGHRHQGVEASEAPSPDSDALLVDIGLLGEPYGGLHLVVALELAETEIGALLEFGTSGARSTAVDADKDVALGGKIAFEDEPGHETAVPAVLHLLRTGTAILIHQHGITLRGVEVPGLHHPSVQHHTIGCGEAEELALAAHGIHPLLEVGIVDQCGKALAVGIAEGGDRGCGQVAPDIHIILQRLGEYGAVLPRFSGKAGDGSLAVGAIDGGLQRAFLVRRIVETLRGGVVAIEGADLEIALRDGTQQLSVKVIPIQVLEAAALGEHDKTVGVETQARIGCLAKVAVVGFLDGQTCRAG